MIVPFYNTLSAQNQKYTTSNLSQYNLKQFQQFNETTEFTKNFVLLRIFNLQLKITVLHILYFLVRIIPFKGLVIYFNYLNL